MPKTKLLFLCSRNPMAQPDRRGAVQKPPALLGALLGTENGARIKVTACHLGWADRIFCMERKHADRLRERFPEELTDKSIVILRIPDDYPAVHDPALITHLREALSTHIEW